MTSTARWWIPVLLTVGLVVAACGNDDDGDADATAAPAETAAAADAASPATTESDAQDDTAADSDADDADAPDDAPAGSSGALLLGDEEIAIASMLCYFEEQPRAGLGGVFTHTAQGRGTNAAGEGVILDLTRARAEDGTVEDDIVVDIGDPGSEDAIGLRASGPEGLIDFGDDSVAATDVEVSDFGSDPVTVSFDIACG